MDEMFDVAVRYEADWVGWVPWAWAIGWALVLGSVIVFGTLTARMARGQGGWIFAAPAVGAAVALSTTMHTIVRHIPSGRLTATLICGLLVIAVACALILAFGDDAVAAAPGAVLAAGIAVVGIMEAATRAAAGVPTSVGALIIVAGVAAWWLFSER